MLEAIFGNMPVFGIYIEFLFLWFWLFVFVVLGIELRASFMLGK
jgi:hypothetical protein